ncbi:helix-turn-helix domain-containing protein [Dyella lipolytica]|uniref:helix-turn-helix domain-containing protein n=1 Tax=Dyella lipolytica TaxID=1867835 RepID=UPI0031F31459
MARGGKKEAVVAIRLREARTVTGLSQRELGVRAGLDPSVASPRINQYEQGKHTPDTSTLAKLGEVLDVPVAYFFASDDDLAFLITTFHRLSSVRKRRIMGALNQSGR